MAQKRKTPPESTATSNKKQRTAPTANVAPFRLLDLAPEIRNNIYACVMEQEPQAYFKPASSSKLYCKSSLARVNRQVREEFTSLLPTTGIVAEVKDFNFGHVITFFNKLDEVHLKALPTRENIGIRARNSMTIELTITKKSFWEGKSWRDLQRWLNRLEDPAKKGGDVAITYHLNNSRLTDAKRRSTRNALLLLPRLLNGVNAGRRVEEVEGMASACEALPFGTETSQSTG